MLCTLLSIGIPGFGGAGIIYAVKTFGTNTAVSILCIVSAVGFIFQVIFGIWQLKNVRGFQLEEQKEKDSIKSVMVSAK